MAYIDNIKNFVIVNDKNKIANYSNFYYQVSMIPNTEYPGNPFFKFVNRNIELTGIEPVLTIYNSTTSAITNQYTFKNETANRTGTNNIKVHIPYPNENSTDSLSTSNGNCSTYGYVTLNSAFTNTTKTVVARKPHVADMQILVTETKLHIFMLVDVLSNYAPYITNTSVNQIVDRYGTWDRIVVYQQHEITNSGATISTTPTSLAAFPMNKVNSANGTLYYGRYLTRAVYFPSINFTGNINLYKNNSNVVDFHCGIFDSTNLYCLIGKSDGRLEMHSASTAFSSALDWKYNGNYNKYTDLNVNTTLATDAALPPFNIYSNYKDATNMFISYSYFYNNKISYNKIKFNKFNLTSWRFNYNTTGDGFIIYYDDMNFIYDGIYKRTTDSNPYPEWARMSDKITINEEILNWKYKMSISTYPQMSDFYYDLTSLTTAFGQIGNQYKLIMFKDFAPKLSMSMLKYTENYATHYRFYGNIGSNKHEAVIQYKNSEYKDIKFCGTPKYNNLPVSGLNYFTMDTDLTLESVNFTATDMFTVTLVPGDATVGEQHGYGQMMEADVYYLTIQKNDSNLYHVRLHVKIVNGSTTSDKYLEEFETTTKVTRKSYSKKYLNTKFNKEIGDTESTISFVLEIYKGTGHNYCMGNIETSSFKIDNRTFAYTAGYPTIASTSAHVVAIDTTKYLFPIGGNKKDDISTNLDIRLDTALTVASKNYYKHNLSYNMKGIIIKNTELINQSTTYQPTINVPNPVKYLGANPMQYIGSYLKLDNYNISTTLIGSYNKTTGNNKIINSTTANVQFIYAWQHQYDFLNSTVTWNDGTPISYWQTVNDNINIHLHAVADPKFKLSGSLNYTLLPWPRIKYKIKVFSKELDIWGPSSCSKSFNEDTGYSSPGESFQSSLSKLYGDSYDSAAFYYIYKYTEGTYASSVDTTISIDLDDSAFTNYKENARYHIYLITLDELGFYQALYFNKAIDETGTISYSPDR
jgi:hypothetical protein